ncbi:hypothetical protein EVAR_58477_1 [Eumeta japonica]|uniref:Uncharacterized protein n=1 Tax=Eumeta variegata TaxID=151549 RepID=A0A4C1YP21_EUMVA|nr:hypothetical protein EVAR_58477_1 [Eumeta japonica]
MRMRRYLLRLRLRHLRYAHALLVIAQIGRPLAAPRAPPAVRCAAEEATSLVNQRPAPDYTLSARPLPRRTSLLAPVPVLSAPPPALVVLNALNILPLV